MFRAILTSIIIGVLFNGAVLALPISNPDQALELVKKQVLANNYQDKILMVKKTMSFKGETVSNWKGIAMTAPTKGWFIFIDDYPTANWEHPCRFIFITTTGEIQSENSTTPPLNPALFETVSTAIQNKLSRVENRYPTRTIFNHTSEPLRGEKYAVLVNGGISSGSNYPRYWNDLSNIYCTLVDIYNFEDGNIFVLCSDGLNPAPDQSTGLNSRPDLDGDGDPDIIGPSTPNYVAAIMDSVAGLITEDDLFLYFQTDHGGSGGGWVTYAYLWGTGNLLFDSTFANYMEAFPQCEQSFTFEQCYSGGFLDNLMNSGEPLRDFNSACAYNQLSYAMPPDYQYDEFVFDWTAALRGEDAYGNPVDADFNNDGYVCMYEAFRYAERNDQCNEDPQYASNPFPYGMYETMNGFIEVANIKFASTEVDDDTLGASMGNNNGQLNAGETIELSFEIKNAGTLDLSGLEGTLESADSMVTITSATCVFPDLPMLTMVSSAEDPFVFQVSPTCPAGDTIAFTLTITDSNDSTFTYNFNLVCQGADINTLTNSSIVAPIKAEFVLSPNPFNAQTELILELPQAGFVDLKVYDALGREIVTLIDGYQMSGRHTAIFNAENYSSGIYFFRLYYNGQTTILKSLLLK